MIRNATNKMRDEYNIYYEKIIYESIVSIMMSEYSDEDDMCFYISCDYKKLYALRKKEILQVIHFHLPYYVLDHPSFKVNIDNICFMVLDAGFQIRRDDDYFLAEDFDIDADIIKIGQFTITKNISDS
jgi:hypothetical protein